MKADFKILIGLVMFMSFTLNAQDQKTKLKEWGDTELTCFGNNCNSTEKYKLSLHDWDKPYMWYAKISSQYRDANYYAVPEQQAYPTFLTSGSSWGDDKMKYFMKFTSQGGGYYSTSIVVVGDYLYRIEEQKDHTWKAKQIFSKEKYKGIKGMIQREKKTKELAEIDHDKIINDFINSQKETLKAKHPEYAKANSEYFERFKLEKGWANQDIKDSYKELYRQRVGEAVRILNNRSNTVFIGFKGAGSLPNDKLKPGEETTITCDLADIYLFFSDEQDRKPVKLLFTPKDWCGKKYIIE